MNLEHLKERSTSIIAGGAHVGKRDANEMTLEKNRNVRRIAEKRQKINGDGLAKRATWETQKCVYRGLVGIGKHTRFEQQQRAMADVGRRLQATNGDMSGLS
jgi:hypothetical protein